MKENSLSALQKYPQFYPHTRSTWTIRPELWNGNEAITTISEEEEQPQIGIALREPTSKEPDVVPMMLGLEEGVAQTIKPISVSLLYKMMGFVVKDVSESSANQFANEDITHYLEERLSGQ